MMTEGWARAASPPYTSGQVSRWWSQRKIAWELRQTKAAAETLALDLSKCSLDGDAAADDPGSPRDVTALLTAAAAEVDRADAATTLAFDLSTPSPCGGPDSTADDSMADDSMADDPDPGAPTAASVLMAIFHS